MTELNPLKPVDWPVLWQPGDKYVPVINGNEVRLYSVYVIAPYPKCEPSKVGYTTELAKRLRALRHTYLYGAEIDERNDNRIELFWAARFHDQNVAQRVEAGAHEILRKAKKQLIRGSNQTEWFTVRPEWARQAILVAAKKIDADLIGHEDY